MGSDKNVPEVRWGQPKFGRHRSDLGDIMGAMGALCDAKIRFCVNGKVPVAP